MVTAWFMIFILFSFNSIAKASLQFNYTEWINGSDQFGSFLPNTNWGMAVGYDIMTETIWLLGGKKHNKQLTSFRNNIFIDHGLQNLSYNVYGTGQFYTKIDNTLWIVDSFGDKFNKFMFDTA
eukprot:190025_1